MGDFDAHLTAGKQYAAIVVVISVFFAIQWGLPNTEAVLLALVAGTYGLLASLLPDIDHQDSKPRQAAGKYVSLGIIAAILFLPILASDLVSGLGRIVATSGVSGSHEVLGSGVILLGGGSLIVFGGDFFDNSLTHRGITHSVPFAFFVGIAAYFSLGVLGSAISELSFLAGQIGAIVAIATFVGILVHLFVDQ